ncbi:MAG TPA: chorismate mutase [Candidatus Paceibacterota bacterium]
MNTPDLNNLRKEIDKLDRIIIVTLKERLSVVNEIGKLKKLQNLPFLNENRWNEVVKTRLALARELGVNGDFIKQIFDLIHTEALRIENDSK